MIKIEVKVSGNRVGKVRGARGDINTEGVKSVGGSKRQLDMDTVAEQRLGNSMDAPGQRVIHPIFVNREGDAAFCRCMWPVCR